METTSCILYSCKKETILYNGLRTNSELIERHGGKIRISLGTMGHICRNLPITNTGRVVADWGYRGWQDRNTSFSPLSSSLSYLLSYSSLLYHYTLRYQSQHWTWYNGLQDHISYGPPGRIVWWSPRFGWSISLCQDGSLMSHHNLYTILPL